MKKLMFLFVLALILLAAPAFAADPVTKGVQGAVDNFIDGCQKELTTYCKDVTPGEGRLVACLYAHQDKISMVCEFTLYDSVGQLDHTLSNLSYAVNECEADMKKLCSDVKAGEGRILDCLKRNESIVSNRCNTALKDIGYVK